MSSILKALKKLEQEKSQRKYDALNIDSEILQSRPKWRITKTGAVMAALTLFMCGVGATYYTMKNAASRSTAPVMAESRPTALPSGDQPAKLPISVEEIAVNDLQKIKKELAGARQNPQKSDSEPVKIDKAQNHLQPQKSVPGMTAATARKENDFSASRQVKTANAVPVLTVNGIAFQEDGTESIAVINGISVLKGSVVEGVTVTEILKDRVKFAAGGEAIEVGLGKSSR